MKLKNNIRELSTYLLLHLNSLAIVIIALLCVAASLLSMGFVFRRLVDNGLGGRSLGIVNYSVAAICCCIAVFAIGSFFRSYFINLIALKIVSKVRSDTYKNLLNIDTRMFENLKLGDIISRLGPDSEMIGTLIINFLSFFLRNSIMLIGAVIMMFMQSTKLSLLVLVGIPVLLFPLLKLSKRVRTASRKTLDEQALLASNIEEDFSGVRTLVAYNQQNYAMHQFDAKISTYIKHAGTRLRLRSSFFALAISMIAVTITLVIWVGSIAIIEKNMSSGQMASFIYYAIIAGMSMGGVAELFSELQGPLSALDRVFEMKNIKTKQLVRAQNKDINFKASIKYEGVSFAYPSRPDIIVLKDLSMEIKHGLFTAIVGKSGSGKSTLMQLLLKFYEYNQGNIFIGTENIILVSDQSLRGKIAYVEQTPTVFSGTIRSNILFSNPNCGDEELKSAIEICGINDFADKLALGIDTEIGERGLRLSGGQKQRIAIARAIIYKPEILLLDEATSALDSESEAMIFNHLRKIMLNKTIVLIAHRISSIERADEIFIVHQGKIADKGKHIELLQRSDIYNTLCKEQL